MTPQKTKEQPSPTWHKPCSLSSTCTPRAAQGPQGSMSLLSRSPGSPSKGLTPGQMAKADTTDTSTGTGTISGTRRTWFYRQKTPNNHDATRGLRGRRGGLESSKAHEKNGTSKFELKTLKIPGQIWECSLACIELFTTVKQVNRYTSGRKPKVRRAPKTLPKFPPWCVKESGQRHHDCSYLLGIQVITPNKQLARCFLLTTHFFPSYTNKTKIKSQSHSLSMPLWKY